jgi:hypothetical protein
VNWFLFWLFLHILAAIIAFGPIFVFPLVAVLVQKAPQHIGFAVALNHAIEGRLITPVGATMLISGSGLIWTANVNFFATPYLIVAVILYLTALGIGTGVLGPNNRKMLAIVEGDQGPTPELFRLVKTNQKVGIATTSLFLTIVFLMIIQPGGIHLR